MPLAPSPRHPTGSPESGRIPPHSVNRGPSPTGTAGWACWGVHKPELKRAAGGVQRAAGELQWVTSLQQWQGPRRQPAPGCTGPPSSLSRTAGGPVRTLDRAPSICQRTHILAASLPRLEVVLALRSGSSGRTVCSPPSACRSEHVTGCTGMLPHAALRHWRIRQYMHV